MFNMLSKYRFHRVVYLLSGNPYLVQDLFKIIKDNTLFTSTTYQCSPIFFMIRFQPRSSNIYRKSEVVRMVFKLLHGVYTFLPVRADFFRV